MPKPRPGEMLLKVRYLSLDPYMRGRMEDRESYAEPASLGAVMPGESVATVLESHHPDYVPGDTVHAFTGWQTHALSDGTKVRKLDRAVEPASTRLGSLGMPGFSAYAGLKVIGKPAMGETVVVAAASGSLVDSSRGSPAHEPWALPGGLRKCDFIRQELGFDEAIEHRASDFPSLLAVACPDGIDVYFESVGGAVWQTILPLLNQFARAPVCGLVAQYNSEQPQGAVDHLPGLMRTILSRSLTLRGFINYEFEKAHYRDFLNEVSQA